MKMSKSARIALALYGVLAILFLYLPIISVGFASVSKARYLTFPIKRYGGTARPWKVRQCRTCYGLP